MLQIRQAQMRALQAAHELKFRSLVGRYCETELPDTPGELPDSAIAVAKAHGIETVAGVAQVANLMYFWGIGCTGSADAPPWIHAILNDPILTPEEKAEQLAIQLELEDDV